MKSDLRRIRSIPILRIADALGIKVSTAGKAMCFGGHDRKTPSLSISRDKDLWHCFGCGKGGDGISLVKEVLGLEFSEATAWLARRFLFPLGAQGHSKGNLKGSARDRSRPRLELNLSGARSSSDSHVDSEVYSAVLGACEPISSREGLTFLTSHGITGQVAARFKLVECHSPESILKEVLNSFSVGRLEQSGLLSLKEGRTRLFWWGHGIVIPFMRDGDVCYLQVRRLGKTGPKFMGLRGVGKPVFNYDILKDLTPGHEVYICEGVPDALCLSSLGLVAVGLLGASSVPVGVVESLLSFQVIAVPDGDQSGSAFLARLRKAFRERGKALACLEPEKGMDISDLASEIKGGHND